MLLRVKEVSWKFSFRYFFPLGRGLTNREVAANSRASLKRLCFPPPNHWVALLRWEKWAMSARTPWPHQCDEALWPARPSVTSFQLLLTNTGLRMTVTLHSTKEKAGFVLSWVFSPLSLEHCPKKYLCFFTIYPSAHCVLTLTPVRQICKPVMLVISNNSWSWLFWRKRDDRFSYGSDQGIDFALHLIKRRKVSEGILWSYWSL